MRKNVDQERDCIMVFVFVFAVDVAIEIVSFKASSVLVWRGCKHVEESGVCSILELGIMELKVQIGCGDGQEID
jgi:hypothetical protein